MPLLILFLLLPALAAAQPEPVASYDIKAILDTNTHTISATQRLTWLNASPDTVSTLRFHLYMNAFRNSRSTFFKESGGQLRGDKFKGDKWGAITVRSMRLATGADLTQAIKFIAPDDGNSEDRTVIEVPLPTPVKPGELLTLTADFTTRLPMIFARTGYHNDFHLAGQWFPKLGVWETTGFRGATQPGWNCHQFHANSEFFANFGNYRVEITVPTNFTVGATGLQTRRIDNPLNRTSTYTFSQDNVTDFVFTAQPGLIRVERPFIAARETTPAEIDAIAKLHRIPASEVRLSDVRMIALIQPEHSEQIDRHFHALRTALKHFGLWYGRYPYQTITVLDPPHGASGAGGMEYPTFITAGSMYRMPADSYLTEMVTVHEFGHQFWMQLVASNEFEESWLDEGFNTYSTTKIMDKVYGGSTLPLLLYGRNLHRRLGLPLVTQYSYDRIAHLASPVRDDLARPAWQYYDGSSYGVSSYSRTGLALRTLESVLGEETMARLMRTYHQRWRFRHPNSRDFERVATEVAGRNLDWFFNQFVFGNRVLDYAVTSVNSNRQSTPAGYFDRNGALALTTREAADAADEKNDKNSKFKPDILSTAKIERLGDAVVPVEILFRFADGSSETRTWDGAYRWTKFTFNRKTELDSVTIDPHRRYHLDVDFANNSWTRKYHSALSAAWGARLLFFFQNLMLTITAIA